MTKEISEIPFIKMHGLGNDLVIIDRRNFDFKLNQEQILRVYDRKFGVGCDQLILLEKSDIADVFMRIINSDSTEAGACGNATRCVASLVFQEKFGDSLTDLDSKIIKIQTVNRVLECTKVAKNMFSVDMGKVTFDWKLIPMSKEIKNEHSYLNELKLDSEIFEFVDVANVGNPHCVLFLRNRDPEFLKNLDIAEIGNRIENHALFPAKINVEFIQILSPNKINMRVWERGAGETLACGSGSCAVQSVSFKKKLTDRKVEVVLRGGSLFIEVNDNWHITMTGPVANVFTGILSKEFLINE
jgi:diaminopimelate epimerase